MIILGCFHYGRSLPYDNKDCTEEEVAAAINAFGFPPCNLSFKRLTTISIIWISSIIPHHINEFILL